MKKTSKTSGKKQDEKKEDHYAGFFVKPRNVFIAGAVILLLVVALAFTQIKTTQTGMTVGSDVQKQPTTPENSVRNLQDVNTDFGIVCTYDLFKDGQWTTGHSSILPCEKFAQQNNVVE